MSNVKYLVYTADLNLKSVIGEASYNVIPAVDGRSAVYIATGIAAQNKEAVIVLMNSDNTSRSAFSGMTEAYYRKLPIVLLTIGRELNYAQKLNDVVNNHYVISSFAEVESLPYEELPIHVELDIDCVKSKRNHTIFDILKMSLKEQDYLYTSQNMDCNTDGFRCKVVAGGISGSEDGVLSNVLGASLCKKRRRYVGVASEEEFLHDMNVLGNININDLLVYIVVCPKANSLIGNFAENLGFRVFSYNSGEITAECCDEIFEKERRTLIMICGD